MSTQSAFTTPQFLPDARLAEARTLFPHIGTGHVYLNHAATSPLSTRVVDAIRRHLEDHSAGTIDTFLSDMKAVAACRAAVARLIHAESPDRVAFALNTSDAINVVAAGYPWQSGDRILLNDHEFPANVHPYVHLRDRGVMVDILPTRNGVVTPEMVETSLTPRTRLVALSAVQFLTGYRADLAAIGRLCRDRGVRFVVDGIQAVGAIRIDVQAMHIDALAAGGQKWQMAPLGTGFLYLTEELQDTIHQQHKGWLSVADPWQFFKYDQPLATSAQRYEGGTLNSPGIIGMRAALETLLEFGPDTIEAHILAVTRRLMDGLRTFPALTLVSPEADQARAGIVTAAATDGRDLTPVFKSLERERISCSLREGKLRFSPHFYSSAHDIDAALGAVRQALAHTSGR